MAHKPKPFKRPGIEISTGVQKSWTETPALTLEEGDMVQSLGKVVLVSPTALGAKVYFLNGTSVEYTSTDTVFAYTAV